MTNKHKNVRRRSDSSSSSSSNSSSITKLDDSDYNKYHHDYHASKVMKNIIIEAQEYIDFSLMIINDDDNDNNVNNNTNDNADKSSRMNSIYLKKYIDLKSSYSHRGGYYDDKVM